MKKKEKEVKEKVTSKKSEKNKAKKKDNMLKGVKQEMKKVTWPSRNDVVKYTVATLVFCAVIMIFFQLLNLGLSIVKGVFN
jgi:preprotein translocase subunit SecE